jgi:hypothetical protein
VNRGWKMVNGEWGMENAVNGEWGIEDIVILLN